MNMNIKMKEKMVRKINATIQQSNFSERTKLISENGVLALDISKKLFDLAVDTDLSSEQILHLNNTMRYILDILESSL